jgi:hypothetical protein
VLGGVCALSALIGLATVASASDGLSEVLLEPATFEPATSVLIIEPPRPYGAPRRYDPRAYGRYDDRHRFATARIYVLGSGQFYGAERGPPRRDYRSERYDRYGAAAGRGVAETWRDGRARPAWRRLD